MCAMTSPPAPTCIFKSSTGMITHLTLSGGADGGGLSRRGKGRVRCGGGGGDGGQGEVARCSKSPGIVPNLRNAFIDRLLVWPLFDNIWHTFSDFLFISSNLLKSHQINAYYKRQVFKLLLTSHFPLFSLFTYVLES
jgi:hypothetical protein